MPSLTEIRGLKASDRSSEEQRVINETLGYTTDSIPDIPDISDITIKADTMPSYQNADTASAAALNTMRRYQKYLDEQYEKYLEERRQYYNTDKQDLVSTAANDYIDKIGNEYSSYYKKYKGTDKLPLNDQEKKELAAEYDTRKAAYGEDNANIWLDGYFKNKVGENQSWLEQAWLALHHLAPSIEGGAIQAFGNVYGGIAHILGAEGYNEENDLNWWNSFVDDVLDNPITRYGRDVERAGASNVLQGFANLVGLTDESAAERIADYKNTTTIYNPEGLGNDQIVTTDKQDKKLINATTPLQAIQSGGFTALSMLVGVGEAKLAGWVFGRLAKGAMALNKAQKLIKTEEVLEKTLKGLKQAQRYTDMFIIPASVGTMEGALEGLNTKIETEQEAIRNLDEFYRNKIEQEAIDTYNQRIQEYNPNQVTTIEQDGRVMLVREPEPNYEEIFKETWNKYKDTYEEARNKIDWASSHAGINNFYLNSLINGAINQTFKAGIMAPRVQETLRNSKIFGWAYKNPTFKVSADNVVTPKISKAGSVLKTLKEPFGEAFEEYAQGITGDITAAGAQNNIDEFIKAKFDGDAIVNVTDYFGSDWAASLTALKGSLTSKESIESAILGALSSSIGTVGGIGRGYHRDEQGRLAMNSMGLNNLRRGLNEYGEQESLVEYIARIAPWRSGAVNAIFDQKKEIREAREAAETLTDWLKDPSNKAKWDGLTGTAAWMTQMENAAENNDQFSYRKAQMGKAINDIFMLRKLEGTDFYDSILEDLQKASSGNVSQEEIDKLRQHGGDDYLGMSDQEIVEKIQSNANKMLGLMSQVEEEGKNLDRMIGRIDEDTKQSLIFGKIMEQDFTERRDQLESEIEALKPAIKPSRRSNIGNLDEGLVNLIMQYGSINRAMHVQERLQADRDKTAKRVEELEAIDSKKMSDAQKEELSKSKHKLEAMDKALHGFDALYIKDEKGRRTDEIDSSLAQLVLNEEDIMNLDPITRAIVLAQGSARFYNATHQSRQKVDSLNLEIDELNRQIEALEEQNARWTDKDGRVRKGHNKQYSRNSSRLAELQHQKEAKMRALDAEQGKMDTKSIYNSAQQEVIDNLVQQGTAKDSDFLDKVVDMGRLEKGIKDYHSQYQKIMSDPKAFQNYVQRAKYNAQRDLTRRKAERVAHIDDYKTFIKELSILGSNADPRELGDIMRILSEEDRKQKKIYQQENGVSDKELPKSNLDRYMESLHKQTELVRQFAKNPALTDNDQSLLMDAMEYLSSEGIDVTDREAAVQALVERDENGNLGGKFREWVEAKNASRVPQQRTVMPQFTSIGQVVGQYVDLLNGRTQDAVDKGNTQPVITIEAPATQAVSTDGQPQPAIPEQPNPTPAGPTLFNIGGTTPEAGHFVDDNGTVATDTQLKTVLDRQDEPEQEKSERQIKFEKIATTEIASQIDASSGNIINDTNASDEEKELALQYLDDIAVNNDEAIESLDDVLAALQNQIERLQSMANQQADSDNKFSKAAGLLTKVQSSLTSKKLRGRRRVPPMPSTRPEDPNAAHIHSANIYYLESKYPDSWPVRFSNEHDIEVATLNLYEKGVITKETPIYFIIDSDWTGEVTATMQSTDGGYNTLNNMPVVAAVQVETPANLSTTTAIEVDGVWYQPIAIMPSSNANTQGAKGMFGIRKLAEGREPGRHLITRNGLPGGEPLTTKIYSVNYVGAHYPGAESGEKAVNTAETNSDLQNDLIRDYLTQQSADRLRAMSRKDMLDDKEYREARNALLEHMGWGLAEKYPEQMAVKPRGTRVGDTGSPMILLRKSMDETIGRTDDRTLPEVLANGTADEVVNFNSRTQRAYNEVIRPIYQFIQKLPFTPHGETHDRSARAYFKKEELETKTADTLFAEETERLTNLLNGYGSRGISDFIFPTDGWRFDVTAPAQEAGTFENQTNHYIISFFNERTNERIVLGTLEAGKKDTDAAKELLRNILFDSETGKVRDFLIWQIPRQDGLDLNDSTKPKAKENYADIIDDGILNYAGRSLNYNVDFVDLQAPNLTDAAEPSVTVANPDNAQAPTPQDVTPQADGGITTKEGDTIEPNSGVMLSGSNSNSSSSTIQKSEKLKKAERLAAKIIEDSKQFKLDDNKDFYYTTDEQTGETKRYLRVTTVIGASDTAPQWEPSIQDIYNKLRERHSLAELDVSQVKSFKDIKHMSLSTGVPVADIRRAIAELRTEHKREGYSAWGTPSTAVGDTVDAIVRDFFAESLKESYPNITKEGLDNFVNQLKLFKADLEAAKGIHIVPNGVVAHGTITMLDSEGYPHDVLVAGTLDLLGYDDDGNFYIFDMKTTRDHSSEKLEKERAKWYRQLSMYADLLRQQYAQDGFEVLPDNLKIIPINVDYPAPRGKGNGLNTVGPVYSVTDKEQLMMQYRGKKETPFTDSNPVMRSTQFSGQFTPGYKPFHINWDNLSSEDQDIANSITTLARAASRIATEGAQADEQPTEVAPQEAYIDTDTPSDHNSSFVAADLFLGEDEGMLPETPPLSPIIPNGMVQTLPSWNNLTEQQKEILKGYGIDNSEQYLEWCNDPALAEALESYLTGPCAQ